jgi:hypothetical protein
LYTWRFLNLIEKQEKNMLAKKILRWFEYISIVVLPVAYYSVWTAFVIENSK